MIFPIFVLQPTKPHFIVQGRCHREPTEHVEVNFVLGCAHTSEDRLDIELARIVV